MLLIFATLLIFLAPQLDPSLTPQKAPKPGLPKIDMNACPFEGCRFGQWTVRENVQLFSTWKSDRKPVVTITKGEKVTAITGVHLTVEPSEIRVTAAIPQYRLVPGDTIFGYMYYGEGVFSAWFNGYWVENFDGSGIEYPNEEGCTRNCSAKLLKEGRMEWWVQIKTHNGVVGWTKDTEKFEGKDALAG